MDQKLDARWGITAVRVMMGVILIVAGVQKWIGGIGGTIGFFASLGIPAAPVLGPVIAAGEVVGGLLILLGVRSHLVALWFVAEFIVAAFVAKLPHTGWDSARIDLMLLASSVMLVLGGAGKLSVDDLLGRKAAPRAQLRGSQVTAR
jgi:putative oxidoreductase